MEYRDVVSSSERDGPGNAEDMRTQPRVALLLRSAKLIGPSGEFLCIVRDVSESGVKLRLFHALVDSEALFLEIATGERYAVAKVWEKEGEAGFQFVDAIDVTRFVAEAGPHPKRPVRIDLNYPVWLTNAGNTVTATIRDLSQQGARLETTQHLAIDQSLRLAGDLLPEVDITVRWRRQPYYGVVFHQRMSMSEFALHVHRLQVG